MADYKITKKRNEARQLIGIINTQVESIKNREKLAVEAKKNEKIFNAGEMWYMKGKKLGDARQSFKIDGREMTDKEYTSFKNGFMYIPRNHAFLDGKNGKNLSDFPEDYTSDKDFMDSYTEGCGFKFGYDGVSVDALPIELVKNKKFLVGYKKGITAKSNENKDGKKRR